MKVYYLLVSALCVWTTPAHSQFFYSHYTPINQISPFFPQTFLPTLPAAPVVFNQAASTSPASISYNLPAAPTAEFRGFGYRTDYKDGASSTVYYVTGPEAQHLRSFKDFPNFTRRIEEAPTGKARSLASDIIDINAVPDAAGKIQSILQPAEFQKLFDSVMPGVVNFYSFPAGTVPLSLAQMNTTTNATDTQETVAAESVVNPKIVINDVDNLIKSNGTTEATTVSEATTTTEDSETVSVEAKEEKSTTTEETTTENTTEV